MGTNVEGGAPPNSVDLSGKILPNRTRWSYPHRFVETPDESAVFRGVLECRLDVATLNRAAL